MNRRGGHRRFIGVALGILMVLTFARVAAAHAELETSTLADGASVPSTFDGPIALTFSAALADGSKADLHAPGGAVIASAKVDGPGATMTITLDAPLAAGEYQIKWVSVAEDTDLDRGTIAFTVASAPPSPSPSPSPTPAASPSPDASESAAASTPPPTIVAASPSASPSPPDATSSNAGDVVLPIIVALIVAGAGAAYLLTRRNRPSPR